MSLCCDGKWLSFTSVLFCNIKLFSRLLFVPLWHQARYALRINLCHTYMGCPESFLTFKIARDCLDLAGRGKFYSLVMILTNCVAKTALPYLT